MGFRIKASLASVTALLVVFAASFMVAQDNEPVAPGPVSDSAETSGAVSVVQDGAIQEPSVQEANVQESHAQPVKGAASSFSDAEPSAQVQQDDVDQQASPNDVVVAPQEEPVAAGNPSDAEVTPAPVVDPPAAISGCCVQAAPSCCAPRRVRVVRRSSCCPPRRFHRGFRRRCR